MATNGGTKKAPARSWGDLRSAPHASSSSPGCVTRSGLLRVLSSAGIDVPAPADDRTILAVLHRIARAESGLTSIPSGWLFEKRGELWCLGGSMVGFLRARARARKPIGTLMARVSGASHGPSAWARTRIGQHTDDGEGDAIATGASENRSMLNRSRVRWDAMKQDVQAETTRRGTTPAEEWRRFASDFERHYDGWLEFYRDSIDNLMGDIWPISDLSSEVERWDAILVQYESRFRALTEREPSSVADATTTGRTALGPPRIFGGIGDTLQVLAIAAIVVAIAWAVASSSAALPTARAVIP